MRALDEQLVSAILNDWQTAPIDNKLKVALSFLEKVAVPNGTVKREDMVRMRNAGISLDAVEDLLYVCLCFNMLTRLADAFDWEILSEKDFADGAKNMLRFGYGATSM